MSANLRSPAKLRIATLTADEPHHQYLVALLASKFELVGAVVEPASWRRTHLLKRGRIRAWFWFTYQHLRRLVMGTEGYRREFFTPRPPSHSHPHSHVLVSSINDPVVPAVISQWAPDFVVVCGTSVMRRETLDAANGRMINVHGGFLPDYRGNHCFFFAMLHGQWDRIGSTIHFVDQGIDTGDIITHVTTDIRENDTPETLYCRCEKLAFHELVRLLEAHGTTRTMPRTPQGQGKEYKMRDRTPLVDLQWALRRLMSRRKKQGL